jgi:hypothetical protein
MPELQLLASSRVYCGWQAYFWSIASMNWPITNGTLWMRLISSCARTSSRFRLRCSSLMYSSCRWMYLRLLATGANMEVP